MHLDKARSDEIINRLRGRGSRQPSRARQIGNSASASIQQNPHYRGAIEAAEDRRVAADKAEWR
ncbi:hypothetical protein D3C80_2177180 [compost metagenome]